MELFIYSCVAHPFSLLSILQFDFIKLRVHLPAKLMWPHTHTRPLAIFSPSSWESEFHFIPASP